MSEVKERSAERTISFISKRVRRWNPTAYTYPNFLFKSGMHRRTACVVHDNIHRGAFIGEKFTRRGERRVRTNRCSLWSASGCVRTFVLTLPTRASRPGSPPALDRLYNRIPRSPMLTEEKKDRRKSKASGREGRRVPGWNRSVHQKSRRCADGGAKGKRGM